MRPFLKWAGSKYNCLDHILPHLPQGKRLIEPFAGSAAMTLNTHFEQYLLSDINQDLIKVYRCLKQGGQRFIDYCDQHFVDGCNDKQVYYDKRSQFNQMRLSKAKAALFIYLNRHGYNGLCRYNGDGLFNVPFGNNSRPRLQYKAMEHFFNKSEQIELQHASFEQVMAQAKTGDVIYCDPPYVPLSHSAHFTRYAKSDFNLDHQTQLADLARQQASRGIPVVISNHDTEFTRECYKGAEIHSFSVARRISCKTQNRAPAPELIAIFS